MADPTIDELRNNDGRLDREAVRSVLPYGEDFLFVDAVSRLSENEIEAQYTIPESSPYLRSHFTGLPLMPGVLVGEGMAQAGTLLVRYNLEGQQSKDLLAFQIEGARFPAPAQPGDTLIYRVRLSKMRSRIARLEGEAAVGDRLVCKARIVLGIVEREDLRAELEALRGS